jgi:arylformamidase
VKRGVKLVGIDYLSIAPYKKSRPTHETLLGAGMVILEGVDLSAVPAGFYHLICLPLKLGGSDGSPARAVLIEE